MATRANASSTDSAFSTASHDCMILTDGIEIETGDRDPSSSRTKARRGRLLISLRAKRRNRSHHKPTPHFTLVHCSRDCFVPDFPIRSDINGGSVAILPALEPDLSLVEVNTYCHSFGLLRKGLRVQSTRRISRAVSQLRSFALAIFGRCSG